MPIYEYDCAKCGTRLEALIRKASDIPATCGKCGGQLRKALSGFSVSTAQPAAPHGPSAACASCPTSGCPHSRG